MIRITKKQAETIVLLFKSGTTMNNLAMSYGVTPERIEDIIRRAMP